MTVNEGHDWLTIHRLRFPEPVSSLERAFPPVEGPDCWLFGPHYDVGPDGMITGVSDVWGGVGIWHAREAAEKMIAAPGDAMPWLAETAAAWHSLCLPVSHRGEVNWRGHLQKGEAVRAAPADTRRPVTHGTVGGSTSHRTGRAIGRCGAYRRKGRRRGRSRPGSLPGEGASARSSRPTAGGCITPRTACRISRLRTRSGGYRSGEARKSLSCRGSVVALNISQPLGAEAPSFLGHPQWERKAAAGLSKELGGDGR